MGVCGRHEWTENGTEMSQKKTSLQKSNVENGNGREEIRNIDSIKILGMLSKNIKLLFYKSRGL